MLFDLRKYTLYAGTALTVVSLMSCHGHEEGHEHGSHEAGESSEDKEEIITPGGGTLIHLDSARADKLGVMATLIEPGSFHETLSVGGRLETTPGQQSTVTARSAGLVKLAQGVTPGAELRAGQTVATISGKHMAGGDSGEAASVALRAAKRELDRLTPLHAEGIVSTRDYNAALQAYETAKAAMGSGSSASGTGSAALAPASGIITAVLVNEGQYVEAGAPVVTMSGVSSVLLRCDLPESHLSFMPSISGAMIQTPYFSEARDISEFKGKRISGASPAGASGYIPVYFQLTNDGTLVPGTNCEVTLLGGGRQGVISVPVSALAEQQGQMFVFIKLDGEHYEKRPVTAGARDGNSVEILSGLTPGERVVTTGTSFVKLAENAGAAIPGHTHNH